MMDARANRLVDVISRVIRQAVHDARMDGVTLVDDGSPEARLAAECCRHAVGADHTWLASAASETGDIVKSKRALAANPANKTALLLARSFPAEPLLPLGDLYGSQVALLAGDWSVPADAARLIEAAGGIDQADAALQAWLDGWQAPDQALEPLPPKARGPFLEAVRAGRFWRERAGLVPKLAARTIGIDLFG